MSDEFAEERRLAPTRDSIPAKITRIRTDQRGREVERSVTYDRANNMRLGDHGYMNPDGGTSAVRVEPWDGDFAALEAAIEKGSQPESNAVTEKHIRAAFNLFADILTERAKKEGLL